MVCLRRPSVVRPSSAFSKNFLAETTGPISIQFEIPPQGKWGQEIYIFGPGHMTKLAPMSIYGKKTTSPEPPRRLP